MYVNPVKLNLDQMLKEFDLSQCAKKTPCESTTLTLWIPTECKHKYRDLQKITDNKFGKMIQKMVVESINYVSEKRLED